MQHGPVSVIDRDMTVKVRSGLVIDIGQDSDTRRAGH